MLAAFKIEYDLLRSQNVILKRGQHVKYLPFTFTEHGILILSSVLNSDRAEKVNILIIDTFVRLREILFVHKDMEHQLSTSTSTSTSSRRYAVALFFYISPLLYSRHTL